MKNSLILWIGCLLGMAGCGQRNVGSTAIISNADSSNAFYVLDFEQALEENLPDTFVLNDIARNVRFVPLQTNDSSLIGDLAFRLKEIDNKYIVSDGLFSKARIKQFDTTGRFMRDLIQRGHGPKELPRFMHWFTNDSLQKICILGPMKMVTYAFEDNRTEDIPFEQFVANSALLNDGSYVCTYTYGPEAPDVPYLYFRDSTGGIVRSLFYPQQRNLEFKIPEGAYTGPYESYGLYPGYAGDALFRDMFNDTIYRVKGREDIHPYLCLTRGKLTPRVEDANNMERKAETIYIRHLGETQKYLLVKYAYKNNFYTILWEKESRKMVANTAITDLYSFEVNYRLFGRYSTPTGEQMMVNIVSLTADRMYCMLRPKQALKFLPGITEDSNPVIMIVDLK